MNSPSRSSDLSLRDHLVYVCSRFLAYGLPLLFFLVETSFYLKTYDSAQVKITFTQIGTTFLLLVWAAKCLLAGQWPFKKSDWVFIAPFVAFLASGLIAFVHTPFKPWSLEETERRVFYMVLALITIAEFRSAERMNRLWRWLIAAAWVAIGYGVLQYFDSRFFPMTGPGKLDPFIWRQAFGARVFSTFGNPNFYGNFLVIVTPLILASVLRSKGSLIRPFVMLIITAFMIIFIDKMTLGMWGGYDASFEVVYYALIIGLVGLFFYIAFWNVKGGSLPMFLMLFAFLFLNLYSTETKGAWVGFTAAVAATVLLIIEYFLHLDERLVEGKKYFWFLSALGGGLGLLLVAMFFAFVLPLFKKEVQQIGFSILWIPAVIAAAISVVTLLWAMRKPWNLKKVVYGTLIFFVLSMGAVILQFAKTRLTSVSFRMFTWISTWEMVRTEPVFGNGVGTFKVIYPAYRRPHIIVLEGKSNTETDHAEDEYIEVWQDEGIVGFGMFLWMIITAIVCGFKQMRWYSDLRSPERLKKRAVAQVENDPRSYEVLGILGAYIGASIHWMMDVSIRFVSSGVFSGLLPGLLVAYARNHGSPITHEVRLWYDRWIRASLVLFWTVILAVLKMELVPNMFIVNGDTTGGQIALFIILTGLGLFALIELLEWGIPVEDNIPFEEQYEPSNSKGLFVRLGGLVIVACVCIYGMTDFAKQFYADVHHNLAIFFSKQAIWERLPQYTSQVNQLPIDIKEQYQEFGGALEHYAQVEKDNPAFPMARYFTGNVHNDRGSEYMGKAMEFRNKGDMEEANRWRARALEEWDKSEQAYERTKALAPNYVQTHHQLGLLYTKRADSAKQWGENEKAHEYYETALHHFMLYKDLDPVFPPNYDRIAQILVMDGKFKEAEDLYKEGLYYNDQVAHSIVPSGFPDRVSQLASSLAKVYYTEAMSKSPNPFQPKSPEIEQAIKYFRVAVDAMPRNGEAWKGLGFMLQRSGDFAGSQEALRKAKEISPNDPDLKNSSGQ